MLEKAGHHTRGTDMSTETRYTAHLLCSFIRVLTRTRSKRWNNDNAKMITVVFQKGTTIHVGVQIRGYSSDLLCHSV